MNPLEKKPNGDFLEIEKYQKVNQKRLKNKVYKRVKKLNMNIWKKENCSYEQINFENKYLKLKRNEQCTKNKEDFLRLYLLYIEKNWRSLTKQCEVYFEF